MEEFASDPRTHLARDLECLFPHSEMVTDFSNGLGGCEEREDVAPSVFLHTLGNVDGHEFEEFVFC